MDQITVKMVCQQAGVSRQALYNHYYCLMDVFEALCTREMDAAVSGCDDYHRWSEGFRSILTYFAQRKTVFLHIYRSSSREDLLRIIERYGARLVERGIGQCAADRNLPITERDRRFMVHTYLYMFMGMVDSYFSDGMRETPAYIASRCEAMMAFSIRAALRRLQKLKTTNDA